MEDIEKIKQFAMQELKAEQFREKVDDYKQQLRLKKPLWHRLFPWRITITKRGKA